MCWRNNGPWNHQPPYRSAFLDVFRQKKHKYQMAKTNNLWYLDLNRYIRMKLFWHLLNPKSLVIGPCIGNMLLLDSSSPSASNHLP